MTLTEFLLARIAEDEDCARESAFSATREGVMSDADGRSWRLELSDVVLVEDIDMGVVFAHNSDDLDPPIAVLAHIARHDPARVLRDCEAKRRIVDAHSFERLPTDDDEPEAFSDCADCWQTVPCLTLRHLATVYADHPDYRDEWKP